MPGWITLAHERGCGLIGSIGGVEIPPMDVGCTDLKRKLQLTSLKQRMHHIMKHQSSSELNAAQSRPNRLVVQSARCTDGSHEETMIVY